MVDARVLSGFTRASRAPSIASSSSTKRIGQRRCAGGLAEHRGGQQVLGKRMRTSRSNAPRSGQCGRGHPAGGRSSVSALQRGLGSAEPGQPFGGDSGELGDIFWQSGFHP